MIEAKLDYVAREFGPTLRHHAVLKERGQLAGAVDLLQIRKAGEWRETTADSVICCAKVRKLVARLRHGNAHEPSNRKNRTRGRILPRYE